MDRKWSFFVVTRGKPSERSNLNCLPNTDKVPVPVRSVFCAPLSRTSFIRSRYCFMLLGLMSTNIGKWYESIVTTAQSNQLCQSRYLKTHTLATGIITNRRSRRDQTYFCPRLTRTTAATSYNSSSSEIAALVRLSSCRDWTRVQSLSKFLPL